jgi:hypothetical protein
VTPKYDHLLLPEERGVSILFDRFPADEKDFVVEARYERDGRTVPLVTRQRTYELDVQKVDRPELAAMHKIFGKMASLGGIRYSRV